MSADPLQIRRLLRRHLAKRHPDQNWVSRLLLRCMNLRSLAMIHTAEHDCYGAEIGHERHDLTARGDPDA
ncbi:MAG TPA: hypothetical protein VIV12_01490 [Streptosporangiaceae bacterium]